jgi:hypothetical protein
MAGYEFGMLQGALQTLMAHPHQEDSAWQAQVRSACTLCQPLPQQPPQQPHAWHARQLTVGGVTASAARPRGCSQVQALHEQLQALQPRQALSGACTELLAQPLPGDVIGDVDLEQAVRALQLKGECLRAGGTAAPAIAGAGGGAATPAARSSTGLAPAPPLRALLGAAPLDVATTAQRAGSSWAHWLHAVLLPARPPARTHARVAQMCRTCASCSSGCTAALEQWAAAAPPPQTPPPPPPAAAEASWTWWQTSSSSCRGWVTTWATSLVGRSAAAAVVGRTQDQAHPSRQQQQQQQKHRQ